MQELFNLLWEAVYVTAGLVSIAGGLYFTGKGMMGFVEDFKKEKGVER